MELAKRLHNLGKREQEGPIQYMGWDPRRRGDPCADMGDGLREHVKIGGPRRFKKDLINTCGEMWYNVYVKKYGEVIQFGFEYVSR